MPNQSEMVAADEAVGEFELPLPWEMTRCLGHGNHKGEWCERHNECARHLTISHRDEPWESVQPPAYTACSGHTKALFLAVKK